MRLNKCPHESYLVNVRPVGRESYTWPAKLILQHEQKTPEETETRLTSLRYFFPKKSENRRKPVHITGLTDLQERPNFGIITITSCFFHLFHGSTRF